MYKTKAQTFSQLHLKQTPFIMANAWSAGSAVLLEQAGFKALGTTSAGIAFNNALPDYEGALSFDDALIETKKITSAVDIPISMDAENGYADEPDKVFENMLRIIDSGVVGANIEDHCSHSDDGLYDLEYASARIKAAKQAVSNLDYPFTLTARAESFLVGHANPFADAVTRLNRYREAGADCLFAPGIKDIASIKNLVREVDGPLNVVMGLSGAPVTIAELKDAGVARVSIGGSLARACFGLIRRAAKEMLESGKFDYSSQQIADSELCELFSTRLKERK